MANWYPAGSKRGRVLSTVTDRSTKISGNAADGEAAHLGLMRQLGMIARAIFASPAGKTLVMLIAAIVLVIVATAYGQIRLNRWNKPFFDALSRRDLRDFLFQLGVFFLIAGIAAHTQRCAAMARGNIAGQTSRRPGAQPAAGLDVAAPGVLAGQCGNDRRQSRSAHT